jgi:TPP-dependent pyruvate/acetoin dehydrogenase alpha subunit
LNNLRDEVDHEVSDAVDIAKSWPEPSRAALFEDVMV